MDRLQQGLGTAGRATAQLISSGWKTTKQTTTKLQQQNNQQKCPATLKMGQGSNWYGFLYLSGGLVR